MSNFLLTYRYMYFGKLSLYSSSDHLHIHPHIRGPKFFLCYLRRDEKRVYKENIRGNTLFIIMVKGQGHQRFEGSWNNHRCTKTDDMLLINMTGERTLYISYV